MSNGSEKLDRTNLLQFVLKAVEQKKIADSYPCLKFNFPNFDPSILFRTIVLQQAWVQVCNNKLNGAIKLIESIGEQPNRHLYTMWKNTTRNNIRQILYDYLHKQSILTNSDEECHQILLKITSKFTNSSFLSVLDKIPESLIDDFFDIPDWKPNTEIFKEVNESHSMIFPELFNLPDEKINDSQKYFRGNINLIQANKDQFIEALKIITKENSLYSDEISVETYWILHCEYKINEMAQLFKNEIENQKKIKEKCNENKNQTKLNCLCFVDLYFDDFDEYEKEVLLDVLCLNGYFSQKENNNFEILLFRICKNKLLFDNLWFLLIFNTQDKVWISNFFKNFARYCALTNNYMIFEMFIKSHSSIFVENKIQINTTQIDIDFHKIVNELQYPVISFIWELWIEHDLASANISAMQILTNAPIEQNYHIKYLIDLWEKTPKDSLAPFSSFILNKNKFTFLPNSLEIKKLTEKMQNEYPFLTNIINRKSVEKSFHGKPPKSSWRTPLFTSKYDIELHDLIQNFFDGYNFSKIFTNYYAKTPNQPSFPHFDHPEIIRESNELPYSYYINSMLPVSTFIQAEKNNLIEAQFKDISFKCMRESLYNKGIRLSVLTFIELVDLKFNTDNAIDYKLILNIFDCLFNNLNEEYIQDLSKIYVQKSKESAEIIQCQLKSLAFQGHNQNGLFNIEFYLLSVILGQRCNLPIDYEPIAEFSKRLKFAELLLFIDMTHSFNIKYSYQEILNVIKVSMPENPFKEHLIYNLSNLFLKYNSVNETPNSGNNQNLIQPALVVFRAFKRLYQSPFISLLQEALAQKEPFYAILAASIEGSNQILCALITLLSTSSISSVSFDIFNCNSKYQISHLLLQVIHKLLVEGKSSIVIQSLALYSKNSFLTYLSIWYNTIENFQFRRAQSCYAILNKIFSNLFPFNIDNSPQKQQNDDLLYDITIDDIYEIVFPLQEALAFHCAKKSQLHLFRYFQTLHDIAIHENQSLKISHLLQPHIELIEKIQQNKISNFKSCLMECNLLGDKEKLVFDFSNKHSLKLGKIAASVYGISDKYLKNEKTYIQQLMFFNSIDEVIFYFNNVINSIQIHNANPLFFLALFASLLPFSQPTNILNILTFSHELFKYSFKNNLLINNDIFNKIGHYLEYLIDHLQFCKEKGILITKGDHHDDSLKINDIFLILFPCLSEKELIYLIPSFFKSSKSILNSTSSVFSLNDIEIFFNNSIDIHLTTSLHHFQLEKGKKICEWRNIPMIKIDQLESIINVLDNKFDGNDPLSIDKIYRNIENTLGSDDSEYQNLLLFIKALKVLTEEKVGSWLIRASPKHFLKSRLVLMKENWELVSKIIQNGSVDPKTIAKCFAKAFFHHINSITSNNKMNLIDLDDYSDTFLSFSKLCQSPEILGNYLLKYSERTKNLEKSISLILHASLINSNIILRCAEKINSFYKKLSREKLSNIIFIVATNFPSPKYIPMFFKYILIHNDEYDLFNKPFNYNTKKMIINISYSMLSTPLNQQNLLDKTNELITTKINNYILYYDLALSYNLFSEYAYIKMKYGETLLKGNPSLNSSELIQISQHFLHAIAFFLSEKYYLLSISCIKNLLLISLQLESKLNNTNDFPNLFNLSNEDALMLMKKSSFPYGFLIAICYSLDTDSSWSEVLFEQYILNSNFKQANAFFLSFQYYKHLSKHLIELIVAKYKNYKNQINIQERMRGFVNAIPNLIKKYEVSKELNFTDIENTTKEECPYACEWYKKM